MTANTALINSLLQQSKIIYLPKGDYYVNDTIVINKQSGIIGERMRGSNIICKHNNDGIRVDIDVLGVHSDIIDGVYYTFTLQNFALFCFNYPNSNGAAIHFRNYTYEVDANFDAATYAALKGDSYAAEFRNCICDHIYISEFRNGIEAGHFLAYLLLTNMFIETCTYWGVHNSASDSTFSNITITYCYNGLFNNAEENKYTDLAIKMCGYRYSYNGYPLTSAIGLNMYQTKQNTISNCEVQECYANGAIIEQCHDMLLSGIIVDANGFDPNSGTSDLGIQFVNGCYNIIGDITATDKNNPATQRMGMYVSDDCHDMQIRYQENNQQSKIQQIVSKRIPAAIATTFCDKVINLTGPNFVADPVAIARFDGKMLTLDIHGYYNATQASGTDLFNWAAIFDVIPSGTYANNTFKYVAMYNATDGTFIKCSILNNKLKCEEEIVGGKSLNLNISIPVWLTYIN